MEDIEKIWLPEVKQNADLNCEKMLLLNKMDMPTKDLDPAEVSAFAEREGLIVYETSAKTGKNVNGAFIELCRRIISSSHDIQKKRTRNMTTDKSLFKSSNYGGVQLNNANDGQNPEEVNKPSCC